MHLKYPEMTRTEEREFRLKAKLFRKVHEYVGLDAQAVGDLDLSLGWPFLKENYAGSPISLLCANLVEKATGKAAFPAYRVVERGGLRVALVGLLSRADDAYLPESIGELLEVTDPDAALKATLAELDQKETDLDLVVLLSHMGRNEEIRLAREIPGLDLIVGGHSGDILMAPVLSAGVPIVQAGKRGKRVGRLDLWINPQGQPGAEEYRDFTITKRTTRAAFPRKITYRNRMEQVKKAMEFDPVVDNWVKEYKQQVADLPPLQEEALPEDAVVAGGLLSGPQYWGSETCAKCHTAQAEWWSKTSHSHAYETLVKANSEKSNDCIGCHSVGYKHPGGFQQPTDVGKLRNVSCENCHGIGDHHGQLDRFNLAPRAESTCVACHTPDNDPNWDPEKIEQIACPSLEVAGVGMPLPVSFMKAKEAAHGMAGRVTEKASGVTHGGPGPDGSGLARPGGMGNAAGR